MKTSPTSVRTRGRFLPLGIAAVFWILPSVNAQTFEWAALMGGTQADRAFRIASDASHSVYVIGWFRDQAHFGSKVLTSKGDYDVFFAKYRTDGKLDWVMRMGSPGPETGDGFGVDSDGAGNVCITGNFVQTADFAGVSLTSYGGRDIFVACFSDTGALKWIRQAGGPGSFTTGSWTDYGTDVVIAGDGAVYVTGEFRGTANFDGLSVTSRGYSDAFLAKYLPDGSIAWVRRLGGSTGTDDGYGLAIDSNGDVILTGCFSGNADIGPFTLNSQGGWDIYVSKWNPNGSVIWAKRAGGAANDRGVSVTTDSDGNVYVTGYFKQTADFGPETLRATGERDGYVIKMQPDGTFDWTVPILGEGTGHGHELLYATHNRIYISGGFAGEGTFGTLPVNTGGDRDPFVAMLNPSGTFEWVRLAGSEYDDWGYGIALEGPRVLISGQVNRNPIFGSLKPVGYGDQDAFLASIDLRPQPPTLVSPEQDATYISTSPNLSWSSVDLATRYDVQVASDAAFANLVYTENTPATHVTFTAPVAEHEYFWRVHGVGLVGPGEWSEVGHFGVGSDGPLAPQLTSPSDNVTGIGTSPTVTWLPAPEADWHRIQVSTSQAFISPEINIDHVMGTSYEAMNLTYETRYFWRVAGVSESGKSTWSAPWSFVTMTSPPGEVILLSPETGSEGVAAYASFDWQGMDGVDRYHLQVKQGPPWSSTMILAVDDSTLTDSQYTMIAPLEYATSYQWRVRAHNENGFGPWCPAASFVVAVGTGVEKFEIGADEFMFGGPGPFRIAFSLVEPENVTLQVFDSSGRLAEELLDGVAGAGDTIVYWDPSNVASGVYFVRIMVGDISEVRSVVVVR